MGGCFDALKSMLYSIYIPWFFVAPMSFPTQEWHSKLQKQVEETQKIVGHYESVCESKKVRFNGISFF